jgi:excisionase family DNA binding protein
MKKLTLHDLHTLPPTVDLMTAAQVLGIGRTKAYELAKKGEFPVLTIRIGDLYRVSTPDLLKLIGLLDDRS